MKPSSKEINRCFQLLVEIRKRNALEPQAPVRVQLKLRVGMKLLGFNVEAIMQKSTFSLENTKSF